MEYMILEPLLWSVQRSIWSSADTAHGRHTVADDSCMQLARNKIVNSWKLIQFGLIGIL